MLTVFITSESIARDLQDAEKFDETVGLLRATRVERVILEGYRSGLSITPEGLAAMRDRFEAAGFATMGGIMTLHKPGYGRGAEGVGARSHTFCYAGDETPSMLAAEIGKLAGLFNEVVIDDGFFTACRCDRCEELRLGRSWGAMRRDLLCTVAEHLVDAAKAVNLRVRIIVKFPQYYDRYGEFGYDPVRFPKIFDAVWQGTETRDSATLDYGYVQPYQGYFNMEWMRTCAGDTLEGAWFDFLDCDGQLFQNQAITTQLAAPDHLTLWCYDSVVFKGSRVKRLARTWDDLAELASAARTPQGVHVVKPPLTDAGRDHFVFDNIGMIGVPCVPTQTVSATMRSIIVPAHGIDDPVLRSALPSLLIAGRHVTLTHDALHRLAGAPDLLDFFGYRPSGVLPAKGEVAAFIINGKRYPVEGAVRVAGDLAPTDAAVLVWAELKPASDDTARVPFITAKSFASGGRALVWNLGGVGEEDFDIREQINVPAPCDWLNLPKTVIDALRKSVTTPLGFTIEAPPRVAAFLFADHAVFMNYANASADVHVRGLAWDPGSLKSDSPKTALSGNDIFLAPGSYALVKRRG